MELNPSLCWLDSPFGIRELMSFRLSLLSGRSGHKWDSGISGTAIPSKLLSGKSWTILQFFRANLDWVLLEILPQIRILLLSKDSAELWQSYVKKRQGLYSAAGEGALWCPVKEPQLLHVVYQSRQQFHRFFFFFGSGEIKPKHTVPGLYEGHRSSCWLNDLGQKFEHVFHPISKLIGRQFCEFRYWNSQFYRQSETRLSSFVLVHFGGQGMFILNSIPLWVSTPLSKDSPVGEASEGNPM